MMETETNLHSPKTQKLQINIEASAKKSDTHDNYNLEDLDGSNLTDGSISPTSLRRSTRVCALKAQKKLKLKEGEMVESHPIENLSPNKNSVATNESNESISKDFVKSKKKLKRKLTNGVDLDQYDCKFGIRLDKDGEVCMMSDESEISSLNEKEVNDLRQRYIEWKNQDVSDEVKIQRRAQIRQLEAMLLQEEARLAMLKKIRINQQQAHFKSLQGNSKRHSTTNINQNSGGNAYKPPMAAPNSNRVNGTNTKNLKSVSNNNRQSTGNASASSNSANSIGVTLTPAQQQLIQRLFARSNYNPAQFSQLLCSLTPASINALLQQQQQQMNNSNQLLSKNNSTATAHTNSLNSQLHSNNSHNNLSTNSSNSTAVAAANARSQPVAAEALAIKAREVAQNNAQRINAARSTMRQAIQQKLLQIPTQKAPVPELNFVPNYSQPDFYAMLGLDLVVQRVRKDKMVYKKPEIDPYECEECGTDFTAQWEAIVADNNEYHLYCRSCVRHAQKRRLRIDQTNTYKRVFVSIQEHEKEFERQVSAGKFSEPIPTTIPNTNTTSSISNTTPGSSNAASNLGRSSVLSTTQNHHTPNHASSSSNQNFSQQLNRNNNAQQQQTSSGTSTPHRTPQNFGSKSKRTSNTPSTSNGNLSTNTSANSSTSTPNAAVNAMLSGNLLQQQLALATIRNNPILAAAMLSSNTSMVAQQLLNMAQRIPQSGSVSGNNSNNNNNNNNNAAAMSALLQAVQQSAAHQQNNQSSNHQTNSTTGNSSSSASIGGNNNSSGGSLNPFFALNTQLNASALMNNPQLLRQFQQAQFAQQMRDYAARTKK